MYMLTDETGRLCATTDAAEYAEGMQEFTFPDDFDFTHIGDYLIKDGALVYDGAQTAEEQAAEAAAERRATIDAGAAEYFADGGRERMHAEIDTAQSTADEAKTTADTAAASVNEYMDALLGLDATDETEATDAE